MKLRSVAFWMLAIFVASIPSENGVTLAGMGSLSRLIGILAFGVGVAALFRRNTLSIRAPSFFLVSAMVFVLWETVSYYWSIVPGVTIRRTMTYAQLLIMVWLIWEYARTEKHRAILMQAFVVGVYVILGIAIHTFVSSSEFVSRNIGESFNPNGFAIVTALAIPMAWWLTFFWKSRWLYWLNVLYLPTALLGVVLAASRGGLLTALVAIVVIPLTFPNLRLVRKLGLIALIGGVVWAVVVYVPNAYPELQTNLERLSGTTEEVRAGNLTGRREIWAAGIKVFSENPYLGVGSGGFGRAIEPIYGEARPAHNVFLSVLVDLGVPGLLIFLSILLCVAWPLLKVTSKARAFNLVLFTALLVGLIPTNAENDKFSWFILGLLASESPIILSLGATIPLGSQRESLRNRQAELG